MRCSIENFSLHHTHIWSFLKQTQMVGSFVALGTADQLYNIESNCYFEGKEVLPCLFVQCLSTATRSLANLAITLYATRKVILSSCLPSMHMDVCMRNFTYRKAEKWMWLNKKFLGLSKWQCTQRCDSSKYLIQKQCCQFLTQMIQIGPFGINGRTIRAPQLFLTWNSDFMQARYKLLYVVH